MLSLDFALGNYYPPPPSSSLQCCLKLVQGRDGKLSEINRLIKVQMKADRSPTERETTQIYPPPPLKKKKKTHDEPEELLRMKTNGHAYGIAPSGQE